MGELKCSANIMKEFLDGHLSLYAVENLQVIHKKYLLSSA